MRRRMSAGGGLGALCGLYVADREVWEGVDNCGNGVVKENNVELGVSWGTDSNGRCNITVILRNKEIL